MHPFLVSIFLEKIELFENRTLTISIQSLSSKKPACSAHSSWKHFALLEKEIFRYISYYYLQLTGILYYLYSRWSSARADVLRIMFTIEGIRCDDLQLTSYIICNKTNHFNKSKSPTIRKFFSQFNIHACILVWRYFLWKRDLQNRFPAKIFPKSKSNTPQDKAGI